MRYEALRLLCFFDLPMESKDEKRIYRNFRKELISNGFEMLQFSVYYRTCPNRSFVKKPFCSLVRGHSTLVWDVSSMINMTW